MSVNDRFRNIVAILAIGMVLALISSLANLTDKYAGFSKTAYDSRVKIQGYVRPKHTYHPGWVDVEMDSSTEHLIVKMSPQDQEKLNQRFEQAVAMLHAKQYQYAVKALEQVIELQPKLPEAYVNLGFALLGMEEWDPAINAFQKASDLFPEQANAYYGLALALEAKQEYEAALGAMRTYIHMSTPEDPFVAKARSALWEWEAKLGRIPDAKPAPGGDKVEQAVIKDSSQPKPE